MDFHCLHIYYKFCKAPQFPFFVSYLFLIFIIKLAKNAKNNYFVISNSPINFAKLLEKGADFGNILNIGPMNARTGAKMVGKTLYIDEKDKEAFEYIEGKGVKCEFQIIPSEPVLGWDKVKEKY